MSFEMKIKQLEYLKKLVDIITDDIEAEKEKESDIEMIILDLKNEAKETENTEQKKLIKEKIKNERYRLSTTQHEIMTIKSVLEGVQGMI